MKVVEFSVKVIDDVFTVFGANPEADLQEILPEILGQFESRMNSPLSDYKILIAHQVVNPFAAIHDLQPRFSNPELTLNDIEWQITNPNITVEDLGLIPISQETIITDLKLKITTPGIQLSDLQLRPKGFQATLQDQQLQNGMYLFFIKPTLVMVKLGLFLSSRPDSEGWIIQDKEVTIGRRDEERKILPEIDITPYLRNPLKISRRQAVLTEEEGRWRIRLHRDARSVIYVDNQRLDPELSIDVRNDSVIKFGNNPDSPEFTLYTRFVTA
jgi:hypothetical protein